MTIVFFVCFHLFTVYRVIHFLFFILLLLFFFFVLLLLTPAQIAQHFNYFQPEALSRGILYFGHYNESLESLFLKAFG